MMMLVVGSLWLTGCGQTNTVNTLSTLPQHMTAEVRFKNLYPGEKSYPLTCQQDCYLPQTTLSCQADSPAEQCRYTGPQQWPELDTGFTVRWLGHASFQIQTSDGQQLLLDPVLEQFDWPVSWAFWLSEGFNREC